MYSIQHGTVFFINSVSEQFQTACGKLARFYDIKRKNNSKGTKGKQYLFHSDFHKGLNINIAQSEKCSAIASADIFNWQWCLSLFTFHAQLHKIPASFWSLLGPQLNVNFTCCCLQKDLRKSHSGTWIKENLHCVVIFNRSQNYFCKFKVSNYDAFMLSFRMFDYKDFRMFDYKDWFINFKKREYVKKIY